MRPNLQLAFDLPVVPGFGHDDFLVGGSNAAAFGMVEAWPAWPDRLAVLHGPGGSGKSHLAAIWAAHAGATVVEAAAVTADRVPGLTAPALVIEDLDRGALDESALFHLVNLVRERGHHLLMTSGFPIEQLMLRTPDLASRLRLAPALALGPPDDALLRAVLVKLFHDRQLTVDVGVVEFVAVRIERSLAAAARAVAELDRESLSRGRRVTRPVAAAVLDGIGGPAPAADRHPFVTSGA